MTTLSVHHKVGDYTHWRKVFDAMDGQHRRSVPRLTFIQEAYLGAGMRAHVNR